MELKQKDDEIKHKDFCTKELNENQLQNEHMTRQQSDLQAKIGDLERQIDDLTKAIDNLKAEIGEMQLQLKRAGEDRERENVEFQNTVVDQRETQRVLTQALLVLEEFYGKHQAVESFAQRQEPAGPAPPPDFKEYKKHAASAGVMGLIQQIIDDAKAMEADAVKSEGDAAAAYGAYAAETLASIEANMANIIGKSEARAKAMMYLQEAQEDLKATESELERLASYNEELHTACDYVVKNFDIRQQARDEEVEALRQAKAILSGSKFGAFLARV
eukprot:NODE_14987_length_1074_cov_5.167899.p2 GENE.NODE_14987_length_1074_cov_5.167899~~NODE_14987_length_1074_cov_5.167899.p2  ORF type:complete len:274 (-),score=123.96 NODE_14987_length_1074_cov_5.167899:251-1072(-)